MRSAFTLWVMTGGLAGCAGEADRRAADTAAAALQPGATTTDVTGVWRLQSISETGDTLATYELVAREDPAAWVFRIPNRDPVPVRVRTDADSFMTEAGPFQSTLHPGVPVTLRGVLRLQGGRLVGTTEASFGGNPADSVLRVRTEGERIVSPPE